MDETSPVAIMGTDRASHWVRFLPAVTLAVVAVIQIVASTVTDLSPWKGGGFGMFAVIDDPGNRVLVVRGLTPYGDTVPLALASRTGRRFALERQQREELIVVPTPGRLNNAAEVLLSQRWYAETIAGRQVLWPTEFGEGGGATLRGVGLTVYGVDFDVTTNTATRVRIRGTWINATDREARSP